MFNNNPNRPNRLNKVNSSHNLTKLNPNLRKWNSLTVRSPPANSRNSRLNYMNLSLRSNLNTSHNEFKTKFFHNQTRDDLYLYMNLRILISSGSPH